MVTSISTSNFRFSGCQDWLAYAQHSVRNLSTVCKFWHDQQLAVLSYGPLDRTCLDYFAKGWIRRVALHWPNVALPGESKLIGEQIGQLIWEHTFALSASIMVPIIGGFAG